MQLSCLYQVANSAESLLLNRTSFFRVIRDQDDWQRLWDQALEHGRRLPGGGCPAEGEPPQLDVDFNSEMVLMLMEAYPSSGYSLEIDRIVAGDEEWIVEATRTTPCCGVLTIITGASLIITTELFDGEVTLVVSEAVSPTREPIQ